MEFGFGQDTIDAYLKAIPLDSLEITNLVNRSSELIYSDIDVAEKFALRAKELSEEMGSTFLRIRSYFALGDVYSEMRIPDSAHHYIDQVIHLSKENGVKAGLFFGYNIKGSLSKDGGKFDDAIEYYSKAKEVAEERNDSIGMASSINNIGIVFQDMEQNALAKRNYKDAYVIFKQMGDEMMMANTLYNLGSVTDSTKYYDEALEIYKKAGAISQQGDVYMNYCYDHLQKEDYTGAISKCKQALMCFERSGNYYNLPITYMNLSTAYNSINELDSAMRYSNMGYHFTKEIGDYTNLFDFMTQQSTLYEKKNQLDSSNYYIREALKIKDSLLQNNIVDALAEVNVQYETAKREKELSQQRLQIEKQKNFIISIIAGGLVILALLGSVLYLFAKRRKLKAKEVAVLKKEAEFQKEANSKLLELDELRTRFLANITHELKTPLTLILGPLEQAKKLAHGHNLTRNINLAILNSKRLQDLIHQILDFSKLKEGALEMKLQKTLVVPFFKRIFYSFESMAALRAIDLQFETDIDDHIMMEMDVDKMEKIVCNLISNAIKYNKEEGSVRMNMSLGEEKLNIEVKDTGRGMSERDQLKIFDRFYQAPVGDRYEGGTGIGLAYTRELIQLLEGEIKVESVENEGSTFSMSFPYQILNNAKDSQEEMEFPEPDLMKKYFSGDSWNTEDKRILLVEDNPEMLDYLFDLLSNKFNCVKASNGKQAIKTLEEIEVDMIISDVMMPEMDGFEFKRVLGDQKKWREIPFILLTARALEEDILKGFSLGIDDYITKPFRESELLARIYNLLVNKWEREDYLKTEKPDDVDRTAAQKLMREVENVILDNIDDSEFKVHNLSSQVGYSQRQLGRLIKQYTGISPVNLILEIRLKKAYELLSNRTFRSVSEVRYEVGIESASYFTKKFTERFGINPKEMLVFS